MRRYLSLLFIAVALCALAVTAWAKVTGYVSGTTGAVSYTSAAANVTPGATQSNSTISVFYEKSLALPAGGVTVDRTATGIVTATGDLSNTVIPSGTFISSHYLHFDAVTGGTNLTGSVTFSEDILGVIVTQANLDGSNAALGRAGAIYPSAVADVGVELPDDVFTISPDRRTLTVNLKAAGGVPLDNIRVIVAQQPLPGVSPTGMILLVLVLSLAGLFFVMRRRSFARAV
jgi:hypothetical protein